MSYILDALKRAERDRHSARVPTLATVHSPAPPGRARWLWVGGGLLLVNVVLIAVLLLRVAPVAGPTTRTDSPAVPTAASPETTAAHKPSEPQEAAVSKAALSSGPSRSAAGAPAPLARTRPSPAPEEQAPPSGLAGLKLEMVVSAHNPAERAAYITGRRYVSGQTLESGATIESIAHDTVVLRWAGHRYLLGLGRTPAPLGR